MPVHHLLVAIDGTLSKDFAYAGGANDKLKLCASNESHVRAFSRRMDVPDHCKHVEHGPDYAVTGWDSTGIERKAWNWLRERLGRYSDALVVLVGHSRGGHIVTNIAQRLSRVRQGHFVRTIGPRGGISLVRPMIGAPTKVPQAYALTPPNPIQPVQFLGLFDAVDMTSALGDTTAVPANVEWFYHALRSKETGSRSAWGNTATRSARSANPQYVQREFKATHGALGGAFPEQCAGTLQRDLAVANRAGRMIGYTLGGFAAGYAIGALGTYAAANVLGTCAVPVTAEDNAKTGAEALEFVIEGANAAGIPMK